MTESGKRRGRPPKAEISSKGATGSEVSAIGGRFTFSTIDKVLGQIDFLNKLKVYRPGQDSHTFYEQLGNEAIKIWGGIQEELYADPAMRKIFSGMILSDSLALLHEDQGVRRRFKEFYRIGPKAEQFLTQGHPKLVAAREETLAMLRKLGLYGYVVASRVYSLETAKPDWILTTICLWMRDRLRANTGEDQMGESAKEARVFPYDSNALYEGSAATDLWPYLDAYWEYLLTLTFGDEDTDWEIALPRYNPQFSPRQGYFDEMVKRCENAIYAHMDNVEFEMEEGIQVGAKEERSWTAGPFRKFNVGKDQPADYAKELAPMFRTLVKEQIERMRLSPLKEYWYTRPMPRFDEAGQSEENYKRGTEAQFNMDIGRHIRNVQRDGKPSYRFRGRLIRRSKANKADTLERFIRFQVYGEEIRELANKVIGPKGKLGIDPSALRKDLEKVAKRINLPLRKARKEDGASWQSETMPKHS